MIKIEFYDPTGVIEVGKTHASRVSSLDHKRIGLISNSQWQSDRMLPLVRTWLEEDFQGVEVLPLDAFPRGTALIGTDETAALIERSGVDAVIIGNAA